MGFLFGYLAVIAVLGLLICFKGRDLFRPAVAIVAFAAVFTIVTGSIGTDENSMITALLAGIIAALLSGFVFKLGVFLIGLLTGIIAGSFLTEFIPVEFANKQILFIIVCALILGFLAVKFLNIMISVCTALTGGVLIAVPCSFLIYNLKELALYQATDPETTISNVNKILMGGFMTDHLDVILAASAVLFLVGLIVQMKTNSKAY